MNGPEELLRQALLDIDGYEITLSDEEKEELENAPAGTLEKALAAVEKTNRDLEARADAMTAAIKQYFEAKQEEARNGSGGGSG